MKDLKKMRLVLLVSYLFLLTSCVSKKIYTELEDKYAELRKNFNALEDEYAQNKQNLSKTENSLSLTQEALADLRTERQRLSNELMASENNLRQLQASYDALEKNSSASLADNIKRNRELLATLEEKEKALTVEKNRLEKLELALKDRSERVEELEQLLAKSERQMRALRETLSRALNSFEGKGLTVEQKNGKVYVSLENKLLFASGSWTVNSEGRSAVVEIGKVLAENPDISVLIEGHTDNVPFTGNSVKNNWELSTKRALAVVEILEQNQGILKENLTAAGRGEFAPLVSNATLEGRAKNRRIEIVLAPKLEEIHKLLNNF